MDWTHLLAFNAALLLAIASPGPSLLYLSRQTLEKGRRAGIATALGLGFMAALWTGMALLGLEGIFTLFPWAYTALKILGAAYLIWIAVETWRHAAEPVATTALPGADRRAFLGGLLVNLANPKSVIFAAAVIVVIFPAGLGPGEKLVIFLNHLAVEWIVQPLLAVVLSTAPIRQRYLAAKPAIDRVAAGVLGALGLRLLIDR